MNDPFPIPRLDLRGKSFSLAVPSSKSLANRALILATLSDGPSSLKGDFSAEDIQVMMRALQQLGVQIIREKNGVIVDPGFGWREQTDPLTIDVGPAGTALRFLTPLLALRKGKTLLKGTQRMHERPIKDLVEALRRLGGEVEYKGHEGFPPLLISGTGGITGMTLSISGSLSSQFISALLLCAPTFTGGLKLKIEGEPVSRPYFEMTLQLLRQWGVSVKSEADGILIPETPLKGRAQVIEGDASSATYWWALGFLHESQVTVTNVPADSPQPDAAFQGLLRELKQSAGEMIFEMNSMPDAAVMLMGMAPLLKDPTTIRGIGNLRIKESDRIEAMAEEFRKLGVAVHTGKDWMKISPLDGDTDDRRKTILLDPHEDHRIAMSFAILGTRLGNLELKNPGCVAKSYPGFWRTLETFSLSEGGNG